MNRVSLVALLAFVVGCVALMGWLVFADNPGPEVSMEQPVAQAAPIAAVEVRPKPAANVPKPPVVAPKPAPPAPVVRPAPPPDELLDQIDSEGDIEQPDADAVARFVISRARRCFVDYRRINPGRRGTLRVAVNVQKNGGTAALLSDARLSEDSFADAHLDLCIRRAVNGKAVGVGALAIKAQVAFPVQLGD